MYEEKQFNSLNELFNYIKPALYSKKEELKKTGLDYIKEEDIWNYLSRNQWKNTEDLNLSQMVSDIFSLETYVIKDYVLNNLKQAKRKIEDDSELL